MFDQDEIRIHNIGWGFFMLQILNRGNSGIRHSSLRNTLLASLYRSRNHIHDSNWVLFEEGSSSAAVYAKEYSVTLYGRKE